MEVVEVVEMVMTGGNGQKKHIGQPVAFDEQEGEEEEYTGPDPESVWDEDGNVHMVIEPRHMRTIVASISSNRLRESPGED